MNDTILCLIEFFKDKDCLNSKNKIVISINLALGIVMNIMLFATFRNFINNNKVDHKLIVSGYFSIISLLYIVASMPDKVKNLEYVKNFFAFPVKYKDIFLSIIIFDFFSYKNIPLGVAICIPAFLFEKSILGFIILLIESVLIVIIVELIAVVLCVIYKCMKYSKLMVLVSIINLTFICLLVKSFSYDLIGFFGSGYLNNNIKLIFLSGVMIISLYMISYLLFKVYKYLSQTS